VGNTPDPWEVILALQPGDEVQSRFVRLQSETITEQLVELFDEKISSL